MTDNKQYPPLPKPDTHCFDEDTGKDVWSYSADQMRAYVDADRAMRAAQAAPSHQLICAVDDWFSKNTGLGGCSDDDVSELADIFAAIQPANQHAAPASQDVEDALVAALERAYFWMDSQAKAQSKGGHATFDLMMLREERDAAKAAIDAARAKQEESK